MNEIITLQFGNYSNFVASHYWNIQESQFVYRDDKLNNHDIPDVNHDVLFREGIDSMRRVTYTPRTILFDLKENINILRLADSRKKLESESTFNWSGKTQIFKEKKNETSQFINNLEKVEDQINNPDNKNGINFLTDEIEMEKQVKYWPDFLKLRLHDRSYIHLNKHQITTTEEADPFGLYHYGLIAAKEDNLLDNFENQLRRYSEECDNMQGFHLFLDSFNGFGGLATSCLNLIKEEFPKKSIFSFLTFPDFKKQPKDTQMTQLINTAFSFKGLIEDNKDIILLPLSMNESFYMSNNEMKSVDLPHLNYNSELDYHTSAILASLADSITIPWRQKSQTNHLSDFINFFDAYNYKVSSLQSIYPIEINTNKYLFNYLQENDLCSTATWFTPSITQNLDRTESTSLLSGNFSVTCKGIEEERVKNKNDTFAFRDIVPAHVVLERYFNEMYPKSTSKSFSTKTGLNVSLPFPNIIKFDAKQTKKAKKNPTISLLTMLQMNKCIHPLISHITTNLIKCNINKHAKYLESGMEYDDFKELVQFNENLSEIFSK